MPSEDSVTLKSVARKLAERRGLDPDLFVRMINQESGFNPNAKNEKSGATGIAQVMSETAFNPGFGIKPLEDRNDPYESLRFAADYLKKMLDMFVDKNDVLMCVDDRQKVVDMWRSEGLTCFQVAPGDF